MRAASPNHGFQRTRPRSAVDWTFSGMARPAGVYVLRGGDVQWQPAIDVTLLGMAVIALAALTVLVMGRALRHRW